MNARDRLRAAVPPPRTPVDGRGSWSAVESRLGVALPEDYKWLTETYGWGGFCDYVNLHTPFGSSPHNGLCWASCDGKPEAGSLLVWATTIDADRLCWLTVGEPAQWPVVVLSCWPEPERFELSAAGFVDGWVHGRITSRSLSDMEPDLAPWFDPFVPRDHRVLRLSRSPLSVPTRTRVLRDALAPTLDRGRWTPDQGDGGQEHFATVDGDWRLTYDIARPHAIRVSYPPAEHSLVLARLRRAARLMACEVVAVTTSSGQPLDE